MLLKIKINELKNAVRTIVVSMNGAGSNVANRMIDKNITRVELIGINIDKQTPQFRETPTTMQIEEKLTRGLGAGAGPEVGEKAAEESSKEISQVLEGADTVLVTCGMGGGIGTGVAPVIAEIVKDMGILAVGVIAEPFRFEAKICMNNTLSGTEQLKNSVDILIVIPNDRPPGVMDRHTTMPDVLKKADEVLQQAVQGIADLTNVPGLINLGSVDVQVAMTDKGITHIGIGEAKGGGKTTETVKQVVSGLLLKTTIEGASHVIINISDDISLIEANEATSCVQELTNDEVDVVFGTIFDENIQDEVTVTVTVTGLDEHGANASVIKAVIGFTSLKVRVPATGAPTGRQTHTATPEAAATAFAPYTSRPTSQGCTTHDYNPTGGGQGYAAPKYSPNQGYASGSRNSNPNSATTPSQPFRPAANKKMQVNISDFLKNKR